VEPRSAGLAQITNYLEYLTAKTLVRLFAAPDAGTSYIQLCAAEMFGALWSIAGASEGSFGRRWQAQERALALELGRGEEVYQAYAPGKCFEVTEGEDSNGTVIRACWLLAGLASDRLAPPNRLAADACFTLLQFNNYRWALNGDASARIDLVRLVLIGQMLGRIVNGRAPADVDFFGSVAPSRVFAEMERIENA